MTLPPGAPRLSRLSAAELDAEILARSRRYPLAPDDAAIVARALAYPYVPPHESYVLGGGEVEREGRRVVLAYGANGAPEVLRRKLGPDARLAVLAGTLRGYEVVYSSHISAYGAIPSTLHPSPGATARVFALLLDDDQLVRLIETEFNYSVQRLAGLDFEHADTAIVFISRHGALGLTGAPIPLDALDQRGAQALVRDAVAPGEPVEEFILGNVRDHARSVRFTAELRRRGIPFAVDGAEVLDV
ncbi:MAG TPA: hypothetical protein VHF89_18360 [Solirubrobacteraceae bacterium]|nr:hypothetical protein [Solirubrobacteraceae bacterium]